MNIHKSLIIISLLFPSCLFAQSIRNVRSTLSGDKVVVTYDISGGKFYNYYTISLYVSRDQGQTWEGPLKEVTGDAGENIRRGSHQITWDAMKEIPFMEQRFMFDVRAEVYEEDIKKSVFVAYVGNTETYLGLRVGMIGKAGWYIEGRMNLISFENPDYTFKDGEINDYDQPGYYEFTDGKGYSALAVLGGLTLQPGRNIFLYMGAGYGWDRYLYEITNYSYDDDQPTGKSNVVHDDYNISGFEVDAGMMVRIKKLLLTAGATTLNFQNVGWTAGIGIAF